MKVKKLVLDTFPSEKLELTGFLCHIERSRNVDTARIPLFLHPIIFDHVYETLKQVQGDGSCVQSKPSLKNSSRVMSKAWAILRRLVYCISVPVS